MMANTGMLIVTNPNKFVRYIPKVIKEVKKTLYIQFITKWQYSFLNDNAIKFAGLNGPMFSSTVINLYRNSVNINNVDVRVLLGNIRNCNISLIATKKQVDVVYFDEVLNKEKTKGFLMKCITNRSSDCQIVSLGEHEEESDCQIVSLGEHEEEYAGDIKLDSANETFDNVVLGGTFDRLHEGHKILLSEALLRCNKKLTVGVTDTEMLKTKKLWELIEPCDVRINKVKDFLEDIDPALDYNVVPISDMYGPTKDDPTFELLVVSSETIRGGVKVNETRKENGLKTLQVHSVDLLLNPNQEDEEEDKISSSNDRLRLLGRLLRPPEAKYDLPRLPYIIGLTGGIASGKSSVSKRLEDLGAAQIECDKVAHNIYKKETATHDLIVKTFGDGILDENGEISRKALGNIIFNQKDARIKLNDITWPPILEKCKEMALEYFKMGKNIVIMDAALLIEAGWKDHCHELWACIIPQEEAIHRLQQRNNLTKEEAKARISSQLTNTQYVENANVAFCTLWKPEFTQKQVERAWKDLNTRI